MQNKDLEHQRNIQEELDMLIREKLAVMSEQSKFDRMIFNTHPLAMKIRIMQKELAWEISKTAEFKQILRKKQK